MIALTRGAPDIAVSYLQRALDEPAPRARRGQVLLELGLAELAARRHPSAAQRLHDAVITIDTPPERLAAALSAGRALGVAAF